MFVIIFVTKWTSDSFLAICRQWPGDHWAVNHYPPRPIRGQYWVELTNHRPCIYCNREEINDPLTCGHRSHSDKLLTANSWSDSGQIARRMRLTHHLLSLQPPPLIGQNLSVKTPHWSKWLLSISCRGVLNEIRDNGHLVEYLYLENCSLRYLPYYIFDFLPNLKWLDLRLISK